MGKGDVKSRRGKIANGSYGVTRKRKKTKPVVVSSKPKKEKITESVSKKTSTVKTDAKKKVVTEKKTVEKVKKAATKKSETKKTPTKKKE